jgi:hypothetical protein
MRGNAVVECVRCGRILEADVASGEAKKVYGGDKAVIPGKDCHMELFLCADCILKRTEAMVLVKKGVASGKKNGLKEQGRPHDSA